VLIAFKKLLQSNFFGTVSESGFFMAKFEEAEERLFKNIWICMRCNAKNRSQSGKPRACRKCGSKRLRLKHKAKKAGK